MAADSRDALRAPRALSGESQGDDFADRQRIAGRWECAEGPLWEATRAVSEWLLTRLAPRPGETILELAAGSAETGFSAAPRPEPEGQLISSDRSPNMVEAARRRADELGLGNVSFRTLDADRIELGDATVDGVLSRFGYLLRGEPPRALHEVRRVLRPGGRLVFAVWAERGRNSWITLPAAAMVERGHLAAPTAEELRRAGRRNAAGVAELLEQAGFADHTIEQMPVRYRFADPGELWTFVSELRGPLSLAFERLGADERAAVHAAIEERAAVSERGYELGGVSLNVLAT